MSELSKEEKKALLKKWAASQSKKYALGKANVKKLFKYIEAQLKSAPCDHTLRHTEQWLKDNLTDEKAEKALEEIKAQGGYCDCEVLLNCYEDYDIA